MKPTQSTGPKEPIGIGTINQSGMGKRIGLAAASIVLCMMVAAAGVYIWLGQQYRNVFFPNTTINGLDVSGKTVEQVKEMIQSGMKGYVLTLETRDGKSWQIQGEDIKLHSEYDGALERLLASQDPLKWGFHYKEGTTDTISTMIVFDRERLEERLKALGCIDDAKTQEPENAYLSDYIPGTGYQIIPEKPGNRLVYSRVLEGVLDAIVNLRPVLSLETLDAYEKPEITSESPELAAKARVWNRYAGVDIVYQFGDATEHLDGDIIHTWLSENEYGNIVLDEGQVSAYVKGLADKYNTVYKEKLLKTSYGPTVTISRGNYGWRINQTAEAAALSEIIRSGAGQTREPIYSQLAASHGSRDYGDTYVEINLTAQHLFFYKDGSLVVESDFVSGNESKGWSTPSGAYPLTYKQRNATLKGEGYATPVSYWMPFNGGIGMHDAGWRSSFGGTVYKTGGSHGCINLPPENAKIIYENISTGIPVLCYHLEGTQEDSSAAALPVETTAPQEMEVLSGEAGMTQSPPGMPEEERPGNPSEDPAAQGDPGQVLKEPSDASGITGNPGASESPGTSEIPESSGASDSSESSKAGTSDGFVPSLPEGTSASGSTGQHGPGGAPAQADTGAVEGPGM